MKILLPIFLISLILAPLAQAESLFPYRATITSQDVHLRAGFNKNFESLAQLNQGTEVVVVDKQYSWCKIILPKSVPCYIHSEYASRNGNRAEIKAERLNVRAAPDLKSSVLGQLNEGEIVQVVGGKDGWLEILPNSSCFGWVLSDFVKFLDKNVKIEANLSKSRLLIRSEDE